MADESVTVQTEQQAAPEVNPFGNNAWSETLPEVKAEAMPTEQVQPTETVPATTTETTTSEEEILDPKDWLKREFEIDDVEVLKAERAEYKKLKEAAPQEEIKFADEQSKQIFELIKEGKKKEVREFLETQEKLDNYSSLEVNSDNAEDIIKLGMKIKNPNLSQKEIDFLYKEDYVVGKEPVQRASETDEEFEERQSEWKEKAERLEMKRMVAAKLAQPDLQKAKSNISLPELKRQEIAQKQEPTQEELERHNAAVLDFKNKADNELKSLNEFNVTFKDEAVEITSSYALSPEEKAQVSAQLNRLAEEGFNANAILADRWVTKDGTLNVARIARDLARLNADEKIDQKFAQDAATKRLVQYRKQIGNINVGGTSQQTFDQQNGNTVSVSPFSQGAWSEKPPTFTN